MRARLTIGCATCVDGSEAKSLVTGPAILASMTCIENWLDARTLANLVALDFFSHLDDDAGTFVTSTLDSQVRHLGHTPVVKHEMDVAEAEAGRVQFDQHIFGSCWVRQLVNGLQQYGDVGISLPTSGTGTFSTST